MANIVTELKLLQKSRQLEVTFSGGEHFSVSCYKLRTHSPSAEAKQEDSSCISSDVNITQMEPVGNYGVKFTFDDGHNTGIYSWDLLHQLGRDARINESTTDARDH